MNNLNSLILEGVVTEVTPIKEMPDGCKVGRFTLGVSRKYRTCGGYLAEEMSYFEVEGFDAVIQNPYLQKDNKCRVVGRLRQAKWYNNGHRESKIVIIAEHLEFIPVSKK